MYSIVRRYSLSLADNCIPKLHLQYSIEVQRKNPYLICGHVSFSGHLEVYDREQGRSQRIICLPKLHKNVKLDGKINSGDICKMEHFASDTGAVTYESLDDIIVIHYCQ